MDFILKMMDFVLNMMISLGFGGVKTEMNAALTVLRCVKDKGVQGRGLVEVVEWLLIGFGRCIFTYNHDFPIKNDDFMLTK